MSPAIKGGAERRHLSLPSVIIHQAIKCQTSQGPRKLIHHYQVTCIVYRHRGNSLSKARSSVFLLLRGKGQGPDNHFRLFFFVRICMHPFQSGIQIYRRRCFLKLFTMKTWAHNGVDCEEGKIRGNAWAAFCRRPRTEVFHLLTLFLLLPASFSGRVKSKRELCIIPPKRERMKSH